MTPLKSTTQSAKRGRTTTFAKTLLTASAASAFAALTFTSAAYAQVTQDVTGCADFGINNPNGAQDDAGATINIDTGADCVLTGDDHIELGNGQDNTIINVAAGTTLTNNDGDDEQVVFFIDNAENATNINIADGATLVGAKRRYLW